MKDILITCCRKVDFLHFLEMNNFQIEEIDDSIFKIKREDELPVFLHINENNLYFEVDLGNVSSITDKDFYFNLLDLNTEILPVSLGIDTSNPEDPRLVLVESRETENLDENELLSVFDAFELAVDKSEALLTKYVG